MNDDMSETSEAETKNVAWKTFWEGYKLGYGVEQPKPINKETAKSRFERWWSRNK